MTATGRAASTGGSETDANYLGVADFATALDTLDSAYLDSPKTCWLMNRKTLGYLNSIVTKYGSPLGVVQYVAGKPYIFGLPVCIEPNMPNISASATSVVLGDLSYYCTRIVTNENLGLLTLHEAPGLVENGTVGTVCFARVDGNVLFNDATSSVPFVVIQNHS